jgi:uncharacterized protein YqeY
MDILQTYLQSSQMSDDELRTLVGQIVQENGKEFRRVMPAAIKATKGRADGSRVQSVVKELTQP